MNLDYDARKAREIAMDAAARVYAASHVAGMEVDTREVCDIADEFANYIEDKEWEDKVNVDAPSPREMSSTAGAPASSASGTSAAPNTPPATAPGKGGAPA